MNTIQQHEGRRVRPSLSLQAAAFLLCTFSFLTGCHRPAPKEDLVIQHQITPTPVHVGISTIHLQLKDNTGHDLSGAAVNLEADMSHPGMAPVFSDAHETAAGTYTASLSLNMSGDWIVLVHIQLADGHKVESQFDVKGVLPS